jgi:hypothetical protein
MLALTEVVEYALLREGQFLLPPEIFRNDSRKLESLFHTIVRAYERAVPLVKQDFMYCDRNGVTLNAIAVKSLGFAGNTSNQILGTMLRPTNSRYWEFDKVSKTLKAQVGATYVVKYLQPYTFQHLDYTETVYNTYEGQEEVAGRLIAEPNINSLTFTKGSKTAVFDSVDYSDPNLVHYEGSLGSIIYTVDTRDFTVILDDTTAGNLEASYKTEQRGFVELSQNDDFLLDWFAAEFLLGLGNLKAITQIEQSPIKWNADGLIEYARNLRAQVEEKRKYRTSFHEWLP